jgi:hypothetical protein
VWAFPGWPQSVAATSSEAELSAGELELLAAAGVASIYSTRFLGLRTVTGTTYTYTVPTGATAVIRSIDVMALAAGTTEFYVGLGTTAGIFVGTTLTANVSEHWEGRQVLNAGDVLEALITGAAGTIMVSGYLFTSP